MSDSRPSVPIFDLKRDFDTTITIGDATIPIRVKRFTRTKWTEFKARWDALMAPRRGTAETTAEQKATHEKDLADFMEDTIVEAITLDEGWIADNGRPVNDGKGLVDVFFARTDVLTALVMETYVQNSLLPLVRKNSNSPRASVTGSEASIPARGGDRQGPTAVSAESSSSASSAPATERPDSVADTPSSSGATRDDEGPIVH